MFGNKILELRKKLNYTQEQLSGKVGVTRQTLSNWESNITSPDLNQVLNLCKVLNVSVNDLIDDSIGIKTKQTKSILQKSINKMVEIDYDDFCDIDVIGEKVKVLDINDSFIKIQYGKNNKVTLIDIDFINSIKIVEE